MARISKVNCAAIQNYGSIRSRGSHIFTPAKIFLFLIQSFNLHAGTEWSHLGSVRCLVLMLDLTMMMSSHSVLRVAQLLAQAG